MNFLKNTLIVLTLISLGSYIEASSTGTRRKRSVRTQTPSASTAPTQSKRFLDLYIQVKNSRLEQVVTANRKILAREFIDDIVQKVADAGLGDFELTMLLQTARDKFIDFTGDDEKDLEILQNLNRQIKDATAQLGTLVRP